MNLDNGSDNGTAGPGLACKPAQDPIEPAYYRDKQPEPIEVIAAWRLCFRLGAVIKYIARWEEKGGLQDLKKARWYLDHKIRELERKEHGKVTAANASGP
jgi:hypothetical protein